MDIQSTRIDASLQSEGAWVDNIPEMGDLRLKVRPFNCSKYRRLRDRLSNQVPRSKRAGNQIDPDELDRIMNICLLNVILVDWENFESGGKVVPFSIEAAKPFLFEEDWVDFRDAVIQAAMTVAHRREEDAADDEKN